MILRCEICFADIGTFEPETVRAPLDGSMFAPLAQGYPKPFTETTEFAELLCPYCGKRAVGNDDADPEIIHPDRMLTPDGPFQAGSLETARPNRSDRSDRPKKKGKRKNAYA